MSTDIVISLVIIVFFIGLIRFINRPKNKTSDSKLTKSPAKTQPSSLETVQSLNGAVDQKTSEGQVLLTKLKRELPENFLSFDLLSSKNISTEQQQKIDDITQSFRRPHPLLLPLTQSVFEPNELFDLIKTDAEMTAKILKVVNSPLFSLSQPITNINHAIVFLGVGQVKNIALQFAITNNVIFENKAQNEAYQKIWTASYMASAFCLLLAKELGQENPAELSTRCLLSYLGDLAMLAYKPSISGYYLDSFSLFERTLVAQGALGTNSAIIGQHIAKEWQLPISLESGIANSLLPLTKESLDNSNSYQEKQQTLICYLSCRLGDLVAFHGLKDVSKLTEISFESLGRAEVYYIQDNIQQIGLDKINTLIADVGFRKKVNKLISQLSL
jgi:HD-like signal output (HDOD) protein